MCLCMCVCVCVCVCVCWGRDQFKERRVREVEIGTQLPNSENAQCNLEISQIPIKRGIMKCRIVDTQDAVGPDSKHRLPVPFVH